MPASFQKCLADFVRICESTKWTQSPEAASQTMVDTLAEVLECDLAFIHLLDVPGDCLIKQASHGEVPVHLTSTIRLPTSTGRMLQMMRTHEPIIMDFLHPDPADQIPNGSTMFRSAISVPLLVGDDMVGMFSVVYKRYIDWTGDDIVYLLAIGRLLGIAVQHTKIARKTIDLEILLERKRLSREIHDQFSQLVNTMNMGVETALLSWQEGNINRVRNDLERIKDVGQETSRLLREEMLSLRQAASETEDLVQAIKECLLRFELQWEIDTDLQVENGLEPIIVSTQVELQIMRILHESFSNIIRHSTASQVNVTLKNDQHWLYLQIHDNGLGFNPELISPERLGLRIMRERAESLGGVLKIESSSETGTTIRVEVPHHLL